MRIAAAQIDVDLGQVDSNIDKIHDYLAMAAAAECDLVVFPECALSGYCFSSRAEAWEHSRSLADPLWQQMAKACNQSRPLLAVIGFLLREGDQLFNASALVGPSGVLAHYRKVHLPHLGVDRFVDAGKIAYRVHTAPVFPGREETQAGSASEIRIGLAICYDCSFPEPMRVLGLEGADVIALATNWPMAARRTAEIVPAARSMENHLYFVATNRIGRERDFRFCGLSTICGPDGVELARASEDQEQLITADINVATARNKRIERTPGAHVIDRFADRRPEFYGRITH